MTERLEQLRLFLLVGLSLLAIRLVDLQVVRGGHYRQLAEQNRLRLVPQQAPRGLIVDRHGTILASNHVVFRVAIVPQELDELATVLTTISSLVHRPVDVLEREFKKERSLAFLPATIVSQVPKDTAIRLEEERWQLPGLLIRPETMRAYPLGSRAAHLLGYLSQPTAEELPLLKPYGVQPKQLVGRMGLERLLDPALQGHGGGLMVEVNHRARQVRVLGERSPQPGGRVVVTIDANLQSLVEQTLSTHRGAAVVLDPFTGAVLAAASSPTFPPEAFTTPGDETVVRLLEDPESPLMNRVGIAYQPGSIVKLLTAVAGLEQGVVTPRTQIVCGGSITIGDRTFHCWNRDGHGALTLPEALMQSCNVYFMTVARRLGVERLRAVMEQTGLAQRTGWPLEEQTGSLPHRRLSEGELALLGIGQGEIAITPLQAAVMASVFANGGSVVQPWLLDTITGQTVDRPGVRRRMPWSSSTIQTVRSGMYAVVNGAEGTGHRAYSDHIVVVGKTGTAQTHKPGFTHGWFVGYCPFEHPQVAFAVVSEFGGSGGELPAEVGRNICEYVAASAKSP